MRASAFKKGSKMILAILVTQSVIVQKIESTSKSLTQFAKNREHPIMSKFLNPVLD